MSFSGEIKEELSTVTDQSRHCRLAELAAIISGCGQVMIDEDDAHRKCLSGEKVLYIGQKTVWNTGSCYSAKK